MNRKRVQQTCLVMLLLLDGALLARHRGIGSFGQPPPFETDAPALFIRIESEDTLSIGQHSIVYGTAEGSVHDWCKKHGVKWQVIDKDNADLQSEEKWVQNAFEATRDKPTPWIAFATSKSGFSESVAANTEDELKRLAPYGGRP